MEKILAFTFRFLLVLLLTLLTQVGGIVYILYKAIFFFIDKKIEKKLFRFRIKIVTFLTIYLFFTLIIVPPLAKRLGRVPLPMSATSDAPLQPRNWLTCLCNRHYVRPLLLQTVIKNAKLFQGKYPEAKIVYFESGFPFFDGFPLLPHLSHDDGRKIDLAFFYRHKNEKSLANTTPHWFGYGISEEPKANEYDRPKECQEKGYLWYSFIRNYAASQQNRKNFTFDEQALSDFLHLLCNDEKVRMILIEPHLKDRLGLGQENKIRLHGCNAVRHDDHIHISI